VFGLSVPTYIYIAIDAAVFLMKGTGFYKLLDGYLKGRLKAGERQRAANWPDHFKLAFFSLKGSSLANRQFSFALNWEGRGKVDWALCQPPCRTSLPACPIVIPCPGNQCPNPNLISSRVRFKSQ